MSARVLIAGIGNIFLGDDGFGVDVASRLMTRRLPDGIVVADIGVRGLHLAFALLDKPDLLLVVDAVDRGEAPGTLFVIEPRLDGDAPAAADAHGMSLQTVLAALRGLGGEVPPILLIGCQPEFVGERMGLSPAVQEAVAGAVALVERTIAKTLGRHSFAADSAAEETA
jgi:hydrogenase maturation protease